MSVRVIAFDADDTLWHNESLFVETREDFAKLLSRYRDEDWVQNHLDEVEIQNLDRYGYGIKAFTLSMIETAISISEGRIASADIARILESGHRMLESPVELLDGVAETLHELSREYRLQVITKGDLFDQESKIARSGLGDLFEHVEIVSRKDHGVYERAINRSAIRHDEFMMVGDSLKSDVIPAASVGAHAVYVPYPTVWIHETVSGSVAASYPYHEIQNLAELSPLLESLQQDIS